MILKSRELKYLQHVMKSQGCQNPYDPGLDVYLPAYTEEQFLQVSTKVLPKLKIAHVIGKAVWELAMLPQIVQISNGSTFHLSAGKFIKDINGSNVVVYGLNGQVPGPIIKVKQGSTIFVNFTNNIDMDSSIHWHGLKLNNKYDGVPGLRQAPVKPGRSFLYKLDFPNEGVYWYHSHFREDKQQPLAM